MDKQPYKDEEELEGVNARQWIAHVRGADNTVQSVEDHLQAVARRASSLAGKVGVASAGKVMGLLHDLGKFSDAFQDYIQSASGRLDPDCDAYVDAVALKGRIDHSTSGAQVVWAWAHGKGNAEMLFAEVVSLCIASHHSGLLDCISPEGAASLSNRLKKPAELTHVKQVMERASWFLRENVESQLNDSTVGEFMCSVKSALQREPSLTTRQFALGLLVRFLFSALIDADRLDSADFEHPSKASARSQGSHPRWAALVLRLERYLSRLERRNHIDDMRGTISDSCKRRAAESTGLYQLTVPTGGGKTLASLRFALHHAERHQLDRIVYVVPYTSIIEQNASVARSILDPLDEEGIVLEHHSNLVPEVDTWKTRMLSENWDAPVIFTTTVQFLEAIFGAGTRGARRMHQLARSVVIFDEVQAMPINMVHLFNNAVNFLIGVGGSTVLFCTATQPLLSMVDPEKGASRLLPGHELVEGVDALFDGLRRVEVVDARKVSGWTTEEVAACAFENMTLYGSTLVVVNTKQAAQAVYRKCCTFAAKVVHLSTNMCPAHRKKVLDDVRESLEVATSVPLICVSTQLIEAGVDVDFGSVVRYWAGLDSIAQAAGRCNRHGLRRLGRVIVVNPAEDNLEQLPDIRIARDCCLRLLDEYQRDPGVYGNDPLSPKAMAQYYQYYFFSRSHEMDYPLSYRQIGHDDTMLSMLSTNANAVQAFLRINGCLPHTSLRQSFKTAGDAFKAIDAPTQGIVVPYGEEGKSLICDLCSAPFLEKRIDLLKKAQRFSVNVFPHVFRKLTESGILHEVQQDVGIYYLDDRNYDPKLGLMVESACGLPYLNG